MVRSSILLSPPLQQSNHTPPLAILRPLTLSNRHPLPPHLLPVLRSRIQVPLKDPLNLQPELHRRLEEPSHDGPTRVEPRHNPDLAAGRQEPEHCARQVLVLRAHPVAVCRDDARVCALGRDGPGVGLQGSPFVRLHGHGGEKGGAHVVVDVEGDCAREGWRGWVVGDGHFGGLREGADHGGEAGAWVCEFMDVAA